jgi:hypothetical protein
MIVAKADTGQIIVGITPADVELMKQGQTKVKRGNPAYGFSSLTVFIGESDQAMIALLKTQAAVRNDDLFPSAGGG